VVVVEAAAPPLPSRLRWRQQRIPWWIINNLLGKGLRLTVQKVATESVLGEAWIEMVKAWSKASSSRVGCEDARQIVC
jgi:hypothetical protein